jgi:hypothetical protein
MSARSGWSAPILHVADVEDAGHAERDAWLQGIETKCAAGWLP